MLKKIILASGSERRIELLERLNLSFKAITSNFDESTIEFKGSAENYVMELARSKAYSVCESVSDEALIIGCDTVVYIDGKILGKPRDFNEAFNMLSMLSGRVHEVYTGIALVDSCSKKCVIDYSRTEVTFSELSDDEITRYIHTGEPMDKAGAYGIQGFGGVFVEKIDGCFYNVVGLPLNKLKLLLKGFGVIL